MNREKFKRWLAMSGVTVAAAAAVAVTGTAQERESSVPVAKTLVDPTQLEGVDGWTVSVVHAEQKPGGQAGWHYHNGYEVVVMQEGASRFEIKGQAPRVFRAGDAYIIPRGVAHRVTNVSMTEPYKILVFLLIEEGKPARVELPKE